jgi:hypothetical protein
MICQQCRLSIQRAFDKSATRQPHHPMPASFLASVQQNCRICVRLLQCTKGVSTIVPIPSPDDFLNTGRGEGFSTVLVFSSPKDIAQSAKPRSSDYIRLIDTSSESLNGNYMTLSHKWGANQVVRFVSKTEFRLRDRFSVAELPRTFQEAIRVAVALGASYLWIDSLCIK